MSASLDYSHCARFSAKITNHFVNLPGVLLVAVKPRTFRRPRASDATVHSNRIIPRRASESSGSLIVDCRIYAGVRARKEKSGKRERDNKGEERRRKESVCGEQSDNN